MHDHSRRFPLTIVTVVGAVDDSGQERVLARGVKFPSGSIELEWNQAAWPPERQLSAEHQSSYGSFADIEKVTDGHIIVDGEV